MVFLMSEVPLWMFLMSEALREGLAGTLSPRIQTSQLAGYPEYSPANSRVPLTPNNFEPSRWNTLIGVPRS